MNSKLSPTEFEQIPRAVEAAADKGYFVYRDQSDGGDYDFYFALQTYGTFELCELEALVAALPNIDELMKDVARA